MSQQFGWVAPTVNWRSVAEDPVSASTALHLAFLTLARANTPQPIERAGARVELERRAEAVQHRRRAMLAAPLLPRSRSTSSSGPCGRRGRGRTSGERDAARSARLAKATRRPRASRRLVREQLARIATLRASRRSAKTNRSPRMRRPVSRAWTMPAPRCVTQLEAGPALLFGPPTRAPLGQRQALAEVLEPARQPAGAWSCTSRSGLGPNRRAPAARRSFFGCGLGRTKEHRRGDLPRAAEIYELAVAEDPDNPNCLRAVGRNLREDAPLAPSGCVLCGARPAESHGRAPRRLTALRRVAALAEHELGDIDLAISHPRRGRAPSILAGSCSRSTSWPQLCRNASAAGGADHRARKTVGRAGRGRHRPHHRLGGTRRGSRAPPQAALRPRATATSERSSVDPRLHPCPAVRSAASTGTMPTWTNWCSLLRSEGRHRHRPGGARPQGRPGVLRGNRATRSVRSSSSCSTPTRPTPTWRPPARCSRSC